VWPAGLALAGKKPIEVMSIRACSGDRLMALICPAFLISIRWLCGTAWFTVAISALLIAMCLDLSPSLAKDVDVADDSASAVANVNSSADRLAGREMDIGRYYLAKHDYTAAINRFKTVVTQCHATRHVEEALAHLTEGYLTLGIVNEARTAGAVLGRNFPDSRWYKDALDLLNKAGLEPHEDEPSWISRTCK
jgi:hypothetical protein